MSIQPQMSDTDKFMENFDPSHSNREKRKKMRNQQTNSSSPSSGSNHSKRHHDRKSGCLYDDKGYLLHDQADVCDCLRESCPGCHFPCPKCRSPKCGPECRVNRRWMVETVTVEGTDQVFKNKHLPGH